MLLAHIKLYYLIVYLMQGQVSKAKQLKLYLSKVNNNQLK